MKRRSFFKSLATLVATVALAPEIAFNRRLELPKTGFNPTTDGIYNQIHNCHMDGTPVGIDLQKLFDEVFAVQRKRHLIRSIT